MVRCRRCGVLGSRVLCTSCTTKHNARRSKARGGWRRKERSDAVKQRDGGCTAPEWAGHHQGKLIVDHIIELQDGGQDVPANKTTLCERHHHLKDLVARVRGGHESR